MQLYYDDIAIKKKLLLNGSSLLVPETGITIIQGQNGSGKTTLFNIIADFLKKDSGSIIYGENVNTTGIIEYPKFYPYMTGANNLNVLPNGNKTFGSISYLDENEMKQHIISNLTYSYNWETIIF